MARVDQAPRARRSPWRALLLAAACMLLAACASLPQGTPAGGRSYEGRFALTVQDAGAEAQAGEESGPRSWSGRFTLVVSGDGLDLDLVSPLGATMARFQTDSAGARLSVPDNGGVRTEYGVRAQDLAERLLGWSLPVDCIADWIDGHPAPGRPSRLLSDAGGADFEQDGWTVRAGAPDGGSRRVQATRPAADGRPGIGLRIVLDAPGA